MSSFAGIWVALVTPFQHQAVDHAALRRLVAHQRQAGIHGLVALGSTGEASALDEAEQDAVLATILSEAGDLPVIAGLSGQHVGQVHQRLQALKRFPLAGLLCPAPSYVRPSQAGLIDYFSRLADESAAPVLLYDIPYRSGVALSIETILTLAEHPQIVGIKDCGGSLDKTHALISDGRLAVLCGEDHLIFHHLCLGARGAISASANVLAEELVAMYDAVTQDRLAAARQIHHALMPQVQALFAEPNPCVIKAALAQQGWCMDEVRPPMLAASADSRQRLRLAQGLGAPQPLGQVGGVDPANTARKSASSACQ